MPSTQDMLNDINAAIDGACTGYKSIQEMIYEIWQCIRTDETTGEKYLAVKTAD